MPVRFWPFLSPVVTIDAVHMYTLRIYWHVRSLSLSLSRSRSHTCLCQRNIIRVRPILCALRARMPKERKKRNFPNSSVLAEMIVWYTNAIRKKMSPFITSCARDLLFGYDRMRLMHLQLWGKEWKSSKIIKDIEKEISLFSSFNTLYISYKYEKWKRKRNTEKEREKEKKRKRENLYGKNGFAKVSKNLARYRCENNFDQN